MYCLILHQNSVSGRYGISGRESLVGEAENGVKRLHFDGSIKLEFRGAKVTTDGGLLVIRELDEMLGLTGMAGGMLAEARANNRRHDLAGLLRQSVYVWLAGYEDINDQEALDAANRAWVGRAMEGT